MFRVKGWLDICKSITLTHSISVQRIKYTITSIVIGKALPKFSTHTPPLDFKKTQTVLDIERASSEPNDADMSTA